jgi:putative serine protease PepD
MLKLKKSDLVKVGAGVLVGALTFGGVAKATGIIGGNLVNACVDSKTGALYAPQNGQCATGRTTVTLGQTIQPGLGSSLKSVVSLVAPSVVTVNVTTPTQGDTGSGSIIKSTATASYILTNNHVIDAAANGGGTISIDFNNGDSAPATIVGRTADYDLAVLKVNKGNLPVIPMGDTSSLSVGDTVIAFGSPLQLENTVTSGIVSALNRPVTTQSDTTNTTSYVDAIQTDAAINPGNSGGPLTDVSGRIIGINDSIASLGSSFGSQSGNIGIGFAIPFNEATRIVDEIIATGSATRPLLGVSFSDSQNSTVKGAQIAQISAGGPAAKAGIPNGAIITKIDNEKIVDVTTAIVKIRSYAPGTTVVITATDGGNSKTYSVTLGSATSN